MLKLDRARLQQILEHGTEREKEEVEALLREYDEIISRNPLQVFEPYPKQAEFAGAKQPIKAFFGGNGAGKTEIGLADDVIQAVDSDCLPDHLKPLKIFEPPFHCRVVVADFNAAMEGVILEKLRKLVPRFQLHTGGWEKAYSQQKRILRFANGSWIQFLTFEQDLDKHAGAALHRVHFDEDPPPEKGRQLFHESAMRVGRVPGGQISITMTPTQGMAPFTYDEVWEKRHEPNVFCVTAEIWDNPHIPHEQMREWLRGMTDEERRMREKGEFVHFEGLVYNEFKDKDHVVAPPDRKHVQQQDVIVSIDPGIRWTGVTWQAFDNDNACLVFEELLLEGMPVPLIAEEILKKNALWGVKPVFYVIDPSSRNRTATNAENVEGAFAREGIYCVHGQNAVEAGVFEIKRRLQASPSMLLVSKDCQRLIWEIFRYRRDARADQSFAVIKQDDHELDALRYACMARPWFKPHYQTPKTRRGWFPDETFDWSQPVMKDSPPLGAMS